jgi:uncharacterized RmlC-like cupin family protein
MSARGCPRRVCREPSSADGVSGVHHHGELESIVYVVRGRARMRWGDRLEFTAKAGPGDFIFVPPFVPHQEINASPTRRWSASSCGAGGDPVVVNLDIVPMERPEQIWPDPIHRGP